MGVALFENNDMSSCCAKNHTKENIDLVISTKQENEKNSINKESNDNNNLIKNLTQQENEKNEALNKRNKYKHKFFNANTMSSSKNKNNNLLSTDSIKHNDLCNVSSIESIVDKIIKIQVNFRRFLAKKKLNIMNSSTQKTSEVEQNCLVFNKFMIWNNVSNSNKFSFSENKIRTNFLNKFERLSFDLNSKDNFRYRYIGYIKNYNKNKINNYENKKDYLYIKNGFGIIFFEDNTKLQGVFKDGNICGYAKYKNKIKKEFFTGTYQNNEVNGFGIYSDNLNSVQKIGYFKSTGLNGIGMEKPKNNDYVYYGEFFQNQKHGIGTLIWKDGVICQGNFCNNKLNGYCMIKYPNNEMYQGQLKKGKMEGRGQFFFKNGNKYIGDYKNDKRDGFGIFIWSDVDENDLTGVKFTTYLSGLNQFSAYIGFWSEGKMNGIGMKINNKEVKFGLWKNGAKEEWLEEPVSIKNYFRAEQRKYMKLFMSPKGLITQLVGDCISHGRMSIDVETEFNW